MPNCVFTSASFNLTYSSHDKEDWHKGPCLSAHVLIEHMLKAVESTTSRKITSSVCCCFFIVKLSNLGVLLTRLWCCCLKGVGCGCIVWYRQTFD